MPGISVTLATALMALLWQAAEPVDAGLQHAIRVEIESLGGPGRPGVDDDRGTSADLIGKVYERRGFAPAWGESGQVGRLLAAVRASNDDGLNPADYHLTSIEKMQRSISTGHELSVDEQVALDLRLTDSLIRLVYHLSYGKVDPETREPMRTFGRSLNGREPSIVVEEIIASKDLVTAIASVTPRSRDYDRLKTQLQQHRFVAARGGWPKVPSGPTIRPDASDPRLATLVTRLAISGDLVDDDDWIAKGTYDPVLQNAVRRFQARHGLEVDGLVGRNTLRALNVSVEQRIDQIRLNLERNRWRVNSKVDDLILVNIAGFKMHVIRDRKRLSTKKVIVGEPEDRTPLFQATLKHIVFNPTWTVPFSIASEEILPEIKADPDYLRRGGYQLFDHDGNVIDASVVDWSAIEVNNFPFTVVQQPGPANQLGQVKFMIPNDYSVCMHDTPAKPLFARAVRALSHGCIRIEQPIKLAELLLGNDGWTRTQIDAQIASGETKTVALKEPLRVVVIYQTAEVTEQGKMHFYGDIYERDAAVLAALDRPLPAAIVTSLE